ncbi:hypothetical protein Dimus_006858 [Dionaea muscipula]
MHVEHVALLVVLLLAGVEGLEAMCLHHCLLIIIIVRTSGRAWAVLGRAGPRRLVGVGSLQTAVAGWVMNSKTRLEADHVQVGLDDRAPAHRRTKLVGSDQPLCESSHLIYPNQLRMHGSS